jgi:hypothetical protein
MNRRGFIGSILAASVAPVFVPSGSLMRIVTRPQHIITAGVSIAVAGGLVRKIVQHDIMWDRYMARYDIWDGEEQYHVSSQNDAISEAAALTMLADYARRMKALMPLEDMSKFGCRCEFIPLASA